MTMNPVFRAITVALTLAPAAFGLGGCASHGGSPSDSYQPANEASRNPLEAQRLTAEAVAVMESDPAKAEELLKKALSADLFHGPAHNNLGVLMLNGHPPRLYEAAHEFEWAGKLMPGHPDPRHNLAMTLEAAARYDDAIAQYKTALETRPGHLPSLQGLTSLQIRLEKTDDSTTASLKTIAMQGTTPEWRQWAADRLRRAK
jgi:tetratricopeptide (TPR) repeat protein